MFILLMCISLITYIRNYVSSVKPLILFNRRGSRQICIRKIEPRLFFDMIAILLLEGGEVDFSVFDFRSAWVGVLPEIEEFFVLLYGFSLPASLFIQFGQPVVV